MARSFNFGAGPAMLPTAVLERAREELLDWEGTGMSAMELSHRSPEFMSIAAGAEEKLRELLAVPDDYKVLFLHGPGRIHFSAVALNLVGAQASADYLDTGLWSDLAITEARRFCRVNVVASSRDRRYTTVPDPSHWSLDPDAAYLHYTPNETIGGVELHTIPDAGEVPLVADMSSNILSRPLDVGRFGLIYAGAQKNLGMAGLSVVIVHQSLLGRSERRGPLMLDYKLHADTDSLSYTAPTFAWYVAGLVLEWIVEEGGLEVMAERNDRKACQLYDCIDGSNYYANPVVPEYRSRMNVPFTLAEESHEQQFLDEAQAVGLTGLKGHRFVGGLRASVYNAMPESGVTALVDFMRDFANRRESAP